MILFSRLFRLLLVAAFAAGIALPLQAKAQPAEHHALQAQDHHHPAQAPTDDSCRAHCLGVSLLMAAPEAPQPVEAVALIHPSLHIARARSIWPHPQGPPPRA